MDVYDILWRKQIYIYNPHITCSTKCLLYTAFNYEKVFCIILFNSKILTRINKYSHKNNKKESRRVFLFPGLMLMIGFQHCRVNIIFLKCQFWKHVKSNIYVAWLHFVVEYLLMTSFRLCYLALDVTCADVIRYSCCCFSC